MRLPPQPIRALLLLALTTLAAHAQEPAQERAQERAQEPAQTPTSVTPRRPRPKSLSSPYNPNLILLDPGHGGSDPGARLGGDMLEKDATIAFANRLKALLTGRGFTVILTHDSASDQLAPDQRAETANRSRAVACILLHASNGGHGVHLFTSALPFSFRSTDPDDNPPVQHWESAQTDSLAQSTKLATALSDPLYAIRIPLVVGHVSVPPIDSMICPAIAVELAPLVNPDDDNNPTPASDAAYQQRIAAALTTGLANWRTYIQGQIAAAQTVGSPPPPKTAPTPRKPAPPGKPIPIETPVAPDAAPAVPK